MMNISMTLFGKISYASLFFTSQLRNPWQMLVEPRGTPVENHWSTSPTTICW